MCGICGIVTPRKEIPDRDLLGRINLAQSHRGPNSDGFYLAPHVGLAMRRLSIIDLQGGDQPISNEDQTLQVVMNGEIYNYVELTSELKAKGHLFKTKSDTETLLHLYEEYGEDFVTKLRGMFAFALWDLPRRKLIVGRDRLGKKPLNYHLQNGRLVFCSEISPLMQDTSISREIDPSSLLEYLAQGYINAPGTIYRAVRKLPPASIGIWQDGSFEIKPYWHLQFLPKLDISEDEALEEFTGLLDESIRIRLRSDVPVGLLLSGGLDSSAVLARCSSKLSQPLQTFTIGFEDKSYDESEVAARTARHFGVEHHILMTSPDDMDQTSKLALHYGEPYADKSALPSFLLSQLTSAHVKVALNGDGGDEALAGYAKYRLSNVQRCFRACLPPSLAEAWSQSALLKSEVILRGLRRWELPDSASVISSEFFAGRHLGKIWKGNFDSGYLGNIRRRFSSFYRTPVDDVVDRMLLQDYENYLAGDLLVKMDIASMAYSLEVRSPFLDHKLVEFTAQLPSSMKVDRYHGKKLLRRLLEKELPPDLLKLSKKGFSIPLQKWFREGQGENLREMLLAPPPSLRSYIDFDYAIRLLQEHRSGRKNHSQRLWSLYMLLKWSEVGL